jgi:hypothetical protein
MKKMKLFIVVFSLLTIFSCKKTEDLLPQKQEKNNESAISKIGDSICDQIMTQNSNKSTIYTNGLTLTKYTPSYADYTEYVSILSTQTQKDRVISNCWWYLRDAGIVIKEWSNMYNCFGYAINRVFGIPIGIYYYSEFSKVVNALGRQITSANLASENNYRDIIAVASDLHAAIIPKGCLKSYWLAKMSPEQPFIQHKPYYGYTYTKYYVKK